MEATIVDRRDSSFDVAELKKDRAEFRKSAKFSTSSTEELMTISKAGQSEFRDDQTRKRKEAHPLKTH